MSAIVDKYRAFERGVPGKYVVRASQITGRLDVKHCLGEVARRRPLWKSKGFVIGTLESQLTEASDRDVTVEDGPNMCC